MKGDFSTDRWELSDNDNGVLYQQGRVLMDADGNAQTRILTRWQDVAGGDIVGTGVAAVPLDASQRLGLAETNPVTIDTSAGGQTVKVALKPGRVWVNGMLLQLDAATRVATDLGSPPPRADGDRDALVLEVWRESLSAFQRTQDLLEPALGGPDTTARLHTFAALRLLRLADGDDCDNLGNRLGAGVDTKGALKVTLEPDVPGSGDCPTPAGGGYRGFEHHLYRIEIAQLDSASAPARFKWSRFNGGLVGRGSFDHGRVAITHNLQAILTSGLSAFYLEVLAPDADCGYWRPIYGAQATLDTDTQELVLPSPPAPVMGTAPDGGARHFFRLWDGIARVDDFDAAGGTHLEDGIYLELQSDAAGRYSPGDYWTFQVRAGGLPNPQTLLPEAGVGQPPTPFGVERHRVPVALLTWQVPAGGGTPTVSAVHNCLAVFPPLTRLSDCCTVRVGDGKRSHGECQSIQQALEQVMKRGGGRICLLPGTFEENVLIASARDIRIEGCGERTVLVGQAPEQGGAQAAIHVRDSQRIQVLGLKVVAHDQAPAVLLEGVAGAIPEGGIDLGEPNLLRGLRCQDLTIEAGPFSGIDAHHGADIRILGCRIRMRDLAGQWSAIYLEGEDGLIEGNEVRVVPAGQPVLSEGVAIRAGAGLGGIQIGGTSERIRVRDNLIQGGIGNGVTLGSVAMVDANGNRIPGRWAWPVQYRDPCHPCRPGTLVIDMPPQGDPRPRPRSAGALSEVVIRDNRVLDMGLNGIGVIGFFERLFKDTILVNGLSIRDNLIRRNLWRELAHIRTDRLRSVAYGGVALADVDGLVVRDNVIEDNGPSHIQPVCGLFLLHGSGVEIAGNRIRNNGARSGEPDAAAHPGMRGGIVCLRCTPPARSLVDARANFAEANRQGIAAPDPAPALRLRDNLVSAPLGRGLTAAVMGAAEVQGNQFVSYGLAPGQDLLSSSLLGATVGLLNLGDVSMLGKGLSKVNDREIYNHGQEHDQILKKANGDEQAMYRMAKDRQNELNMHKGAGSPQGIQVSQQGLTMQHAASAIGKLLDPKLAYKGHILFNGNQCGLHLGPDPQGQHLGLDARLGLLSLCSVAVAGIGDIGYDGNQSTVEIRRDGLLVTNALIAAHSVRVTDSLFREGLDDAWLSAICAAPANNVTNNQAIHCLLVMPLFGPWTVPLPNTVVLNPPGCIWLNLALNGAVYKRAVGRFRMRSTGGG